jgi:signal transduction histidine kinase
MMISNNFSAAEAERIKELKRYEILDTPPDFSFDRLTRLAAKLFDVPVAIISLVDQDRVWFKSRHGIDVQQVALNPGLCTATILTDEVYVVQDALEEESTFLNPLVTGDFALRFYAGAPLRTKEGYNLGSFCIIDKKPRNLSEEDKQVMKELAGVVMDHLEARLSARQANAQQNQLLQIAAHDLKNPLTTIPVRADLIKLKKHDPEAVDKMCDQIKQAGLKMTRTIDDLLTTASIESGRISLYTFKLDFADIVSQIVDSNQALADNKEQEIELNIEGRPYVIADEQRLIEVVDNLISNAIKYSPKGELIKVNIAHKDQKAVLVVKDNGPGLTQEDKDQLFQRFAKLSAKPTGGESSTGLGLSIVKQLVDAHNGRVWAESEGLNTGSAFIVEIPSIN